VTNSDTLIFLATYNEAENVGAMHGLIRELIPAADILFIDDNSPDGTGVIIDTICDKDPRVNVIHRPGKLGIGSAHLDGIRWAYDHDYRLLVTMDSDFAHSPDLIPQFITASEQNDIVIGTRFAVDGSLKEWNLHRIALTHLGHLLTRLLLGMPFDATGAFRCYALERIPHAVFQRVTSRDYAFFFESLHVLHLNGYSVKEVPISLPARVYGTSKMRLRDVFFGFKKLLTHAANSRFRKHRYLVTKDTQPEPDMKAGWEAYWTKDTSESWANLGYELAAKFYRNVIIKPTLNHFLRKHIPRGAKLMHAGCGGGEVDSDAVKDFDIFAYDISSMALARYFKLHSGDAVLVNGDLLNMAFADDSFNGIYNLGVVEHFEIDQLKKIFSIFHRVLKPGGKIVIFWPPRFGLSVKALKFIHFVLNDIFHKNIRLHPPEPSLLPSRKFAQEMLEPIGFKIVDYYFGPRDMFTHATVVARAIK